MKIYGDKKSGNCYKIQLTCALLDLDYEWIDVDILANECQSEAFKKLNPNAKIPLLVLDNNTDDNRTLAESNAIINFLSYDSHLQPKDPFGLAKMQQWQFFEQYSHEPYIAVARFINKYLGLPADRLSEYKAKQVGGNKALTVMNQQLSKTDFLVSDSISCADISLFAYTHVAHEGGFSVAEFPFVESWIARVKAQSKYVPMG